jgi:predicted small lipoprotein YifL
MLLACGKTGALYLPEEPPAEPEKNTQSQNGQAQSQDTSNDGKAD